MANQKKYLDLSGLQNFASSLLDKFALKNHNHDNSYAVKSHTHTTAQVTGLDGALAGKAPTNHNHSTDNLTSGTLPIARGGTGNSDGKAAANYFMNALDEGTSAPTDNDYYISQYAGGGTATKTYHRRPVSALWSYIKSKTDYLYQPKGSYASSGHTHTIGNVTNLQSSLDGKAALSHGHPAVTQSVAGFMSAADKTKLDGIATGANKTIVDTALSSTSTNPVQNKVVNSALAGKAASSHTHTISNITNLQDTLDGKQPKGSYAASSHTHTIANVNGLQPALDKKEDKQNPVTTSGTGAAYTATVPGITGLAAGVSFMMVPHATSTTTTPSLNVNNLGAKMIRQRLSNMSSGTVPASVDNFLGANKPVKMTYDGMFWIADFTRPHMATAYGTLPVENGGTGATTAEQARNNLKFYKTLWAGGGWTKGNVTVSDTLKYRVFAARVMDEGSPILIGIRNEIIEDGTAGWIRFYGYYKSSISSAVLTGFSATYQNNIWTHNGLFTTITDSAHSSYGPDKTVNAIYGIC